MPFKFEIQISFIKLFFAIKHKISQIQSPGTKA